MSEENGRVDLSRLRHVQSKDPTDPPLGADTDGVSADRLGLMEGGFRGHDGIRRGGRTCSIRDTF